MLTRDQYLKIAAENPRRIKSVRFLIHLLMDVSFWVSMIILFHHAPGWISLGTNALIFAAFTFRAFGLMHDCVHDAVWERRKLNRVTGVIWGLFCFLPFSSWRKLHLDHHRWTGNVEKDPSMKLLVEFRDRGGRPRDSLSWYWHSWFPGLAFEQHLVFWRETIGKRQLAFVPALMAYLVAAAQLIGPAALGLGLVCYLFMVEIINFPHHLGLRQYDDKSQFKPFEQTRFTRSCIYPRWFANIFLCNFNLHNEHHLFPAHPWYQLDQIHFAVARLDINLNESTGNKWIVEHRGQSLEQVFGQTFSDAPLDLNTSDKPEIRVA